MNWILASVAGWFALLWAYVAVMHAKAVTERGELSTFWKVHILPLAVIGALLDAVFNLTVAVVLFRELPKELLFSSRVQRHYRTEGSRGRMAEFWARQLNAFDADHIHEPRQ